MIYKSATKAAEIKWQLGHSTVLWLGHNRNTGATIVWVVVWYRDGKPGKSLRVTGGNISRLAAEIERDIPAVGQFIYRNAAAMACIQGG